MMLISTPTERINTCADPPSKAMHRSCERINNSANHFIAASEKLPAKFRTVAKREGDSSRVSRALLWLLLLVAFLSTSCSSSELAQQVQAESPTIRPNIILILTD